MIVKQIKLSSRSKDKLSRLKGKTGIKNWNVLCRWALCYSLHEGTEKMIYVYKNVIGNADSRTHDFGDNARKIVEDARGKVASILGINKDEVFFTSGATESNNIVIQGLEEYGRSEKRMHIITTAIEHKAVLETAKAMQKRGFEVDFIAPGSDGRVSAEEVLSKVRDDTLIVSVMHVNNETGVIQPVKEIGDALAGTGTYFHVDATQSFGKLVDELKELKYDMMSMSAHKLGGPQGVGGLILRKKHYKLPPVKNITYGGQQEKGIRPGTTPVALVAGLGEACSIAELEYRTNYDKNIKIRNIVKELLAESSLDYSINGDENNTMVSTLNIEIKGVSSEALMLATKQFVSYVLKSIQNFSGQELDVDYSDFEIRDDVITSIRKYMDGFVSLVNSTYGLDEKYKTDDSKGDSFWNNLISAEPNELFTLLQKKKDGVLTTGEFEGYLLDHSFSYDDQTKQYVAEVDSDIFTDVIIRVGDATFDIYATILNVYSDVNEEDDSDKEKYEKLKEKVVEEFQGKTELIPQIGKDDSKEDDSDYIMFKGNPFDTNLVSVVYDLLSKKYIEE